MSYSQGGRLDGYTVGCYQGDGMTPVTEGPGSWLPDAGGQGRGNWGVGGRKDKVRVTVGRGTESSSERLRWDLPGVGVTGSERLGVE